MYEDICARNQGLVNLLARRYARLCALDRAVSREDLIQAGYIGLINAARTYDPAAGKSWASWAAWYIRGEFERALGMRHGRFTRAHTGADTLNRRVRLPNGPGEAAIDALADPSLPPADENLLKQELVQAVRQAVDRLPTEGQRTATRLCRLEGLTYPQAAGQMGVSATRARKLCEKAAQNLARDGRLRRQLCLDDRTRFHAHKSVAAFNRDWTSVTEAAALWRLEQERF